MVAQLNNKCTRPESVVVRSKKIRRRKSQASPKHSYRHTNSVRTSTIHFYSVSRCLQVQKADLILLLKISHVYFFPFILIFYLQQYSNCNQQKNKVNSETQTEYIYANSQPYEEDSIGSHILSVEDEDLMNANVLPSIYQVR